MGKSTSSPFVDPDECEAELQNSACFHVRRAARAVTRFYDLALQPAGLKSNQHVLLTAIHSESPCALATLEDKLEMAQSTLSRNLQPLIRDGLVLERKVRGERGRRLRLSAKGLRLLDRCRKLWAEAQTSFERGIGKRNWSSVRRDLVRVRDAARGS